MLEQGAGEDELLSGYPSLRREQVAPARRIADRVSDLERKLLLSCFSIDHENDTLLPPTGFTHPGWMITSLMRCDVSRPRILQAPVATRAWPSLPFTLEGQPPK
jgi:hypothetical protein